MSRPFSELDYTLIMSFLEKYPDRHADRKITIIREDGTSLMGVRPIKEFQPPLVYTLSNRWFDSYAK